MTPAAPYTICANGCGVPARWKVKRGGRTVNMCNGCAERSKRTISATYLTRTEAEKRRKHEVLSRLGY